MKLKKIGNVLMIFLLLFFFLKLTGVSAQEVDPSTIKVSEATGIITVDGDLSEPDWSDENPYLLFRIGGEPAGSANTPSGFVVVKPEYTDTSACKVKFLRDGMNLFISLDSDDKQVCRFGDSWEGDGLFMKIKDADGNFVEYKLYFNLPGADPDIHYEGTAGSEGAGVKRPGTIVNDSTNVDSGYTAELRIDLNDLGYSDVPNSVDVLINIFDPDNFNDGDAAWDVHGNFAKQWWGSEWGPETRTLILKDPNSDPDSLMVYKTDGIVVDGVLDEPIWNADTPTLMFKIGGTGEKNIYTPTGYTVVKPEYTDTSTCYVKFAHDGENLFIALNSDDKQVCRFGDSWEGDGLFMKITDASGTDVEYKLYYNLSGTDPDIHYEGPDHSEGAGVKGDATVVNDSTNTDNGYTAELRINLAALGFDHPSSVKVLINIFDPDNYNDGDGAWGVHGNYAKQWWGSEWGPEKRTLVLNDAVIDPPSITVFSASQPINIDGVLDESDWTEDVPRLKFEIGGNVSGNDLGPTGYAIVKPSYTDTSTCFVRFLHDDTNLYISLNSNDQQVCRFGDSWEGDGLFMKIKDANGTDVEYKLYYNLSGFDPDIHYEGPAGSEGAGMKGPGTVVNDSANVDGGYTAELKINMADLGYTTIPDTLHVLINVFDPDNYNDGDGAWGVHGNYAKQWWGSEWGPGMRNLIITDQLVGIKEQGQTLPETFSVEQNYPNPFNPSTTIKFSLPVSANVTLTVYNVLGARVMEFEPKKFSAGAHSINVNASSLASGIYFYKIDAKGDNGKHYIGSKKMVLLK